METIGWVILAALAIKYVTFAIGFWVCSRSWKR